jgi:hemoglobin-like flavoprotein
LDEVTESFHRCRRDERFFGTFYAIFLAKSPEIAAMFGDTDFNLQHLLLRESILMVLAFNLGMAGAREEFICLGERHRELGVTSEHYAMWLDAFCEAVGRHDPKFTPELELRWRELLQSAVRQMTSAP